MSSGDSTKSCTTCNLTELNDYLQFLPKHERDLRIRAYLFANDRKDDWDALYFGKAIKVNIEELKNYGVALSERARKFILATANPINIGIDSYQICQGLGIEIDDIIMESTTKPFRDFAAEVRSENLEDMMFRMRQSFLKAFDKLANNKPEAALEWLHRFSQDKVLPALMSPNQQLSGSDDGVIDVQYVPLPESDEATN